MYELCINTGLGFGGGPEGTVPLIKEAGFDGFFTSYHPGKTKQIAELADRYGLMYQSVHAPFNETDALWEPGDKGEYVKEKLIECVNECKDAGVPLIVFHAIIGMDRHDPTETGLQRFCRVVKRAEKIGINIAFENTEGVEYLNAVMDRFRSSYVGFCWDTGHELCYNYGADMTEKYGDRLTCTHLNDNFGMTDRENMTWLDDAHMMPFDGVTDWQSVADRLKKHGYKGALTFELTCKSKPGRSTHDIYSSYDELEFLKLAHEKAVKFREML
ncbi:MAG: sugar phosphate isomerase/epimerase [Clostridia bacterium]|nr:sugar phosphate isomerase/epimerase [Clostridia bacterium]